MLKNEAEQKKRKKYIIYHLTFHYVGNMFRIVLWTIIRKKNIVLGLLNQAYALPR